MESTEMCIQPRQKHYVFSGDGTSMNNHLSHFNMGCKIYERFIPIFSSTQNSDGNEDKEKIAQELYTQVGLQSDSKFRYTESCYLGERSLVDTSESSFICENLTLGVFWSSSRVLHFQLRKLEDLKKKTYQCFILTSLSYLPEIFPKFGAQST